MPRLDSDFSFSLRRRRSASPYYWWVRASRARKIGRIWWIFGIILAIRVYINIYIYMYMRVL